MESLRDKNAAWWDGGREERKRSTPSTVIIYFNNGYLIKHLQQLRIYDCVCGRASFNNNQRWLRGCVVKAKFATT